MLAEAERQTPELVRRSYEATYREMRNSGFTQSASSTTSACRRRSRQWRLRPPLASSSCSCTLCTPAAASRFAESVEAYLRQVEELRAAKVRVVAPHSVRACPAEWLAEIGRYAEGEQLPLHVHADEQPKEIEECLAEHGCRPIELLAQTGCLGKRTTVVHATHADGTELDLLASTGATICACPTTEADLGDGFLPAERIRARGILCIGSDSNVRIDPFEELRELEGIARRQTGRRGIFTTEELYRFGSELGADALGLELARSRDRPGTSCARGYRAR